MFLSEATRMIQIVEEKHMSPEMDSQIRRRLCVCFPQYEPVFSVTRAWHGSAPAYSALVCEAGEVIAHIGVVERRLTVGNTPLCVAGIQNVMVLPDHRGRGWIDQVMAQAMAEAQKRQFDCGLLFCDPALVKTYSRCRWETLDDRPIIRVDDGREQPLPASGLTMFFPLRVRQLPPGTIHLRGNDW